MTCSSPEANRPQGCPGLWGRAWGAGSPEADGDYAQHRPELRGRQLGAGWGPLTEQGWDVQVMARTGDS